MGTGWQQHVQQLVTQDRAATVLIPRQIPLKVRKWCTCTCISDTGLLIAYQQNIYLLVCLQLITFTNIYRHKTIAVLLGLGWDNRTDSRLLSVVGIILAGGTYMLSAKLSQSCCLVVVSRDFLLLSLIIFRFLPNHSVNLKHTDSDVWNTSSIGIRLAEH